MPETSPLTDETRTIRACSKGLSKVCFSSPPAQTAFLTDCPSPTAMAQGESIGVFPEGTSHTSPHMLPFKDGVAWAALEYVKYLSGAADGVKRSGKKATIIPVGITYLDKAKYRSSIVVE